MSVRLENLHSDAAPSNYVSFLGHAPKSKGRQADNESLKSVSSVRSAMSGMSSMWSHFTLSNSAAKAEKQMAQHRDDIKYLYSCFTKIPALKLAPDTRARLVSGFEEFPFDTAVPLFCFKNLSAVEVCDIDFRQFFGWDRLAENVRSLTLKRAQVDDPIDILSNIVLDDMDKRRRRSSKIAAPQTPSTPGAPWPLSSPRLRHPELARSFSTPNSPASDQVLRRGSADSPKSLLLSRAGSSEGKKTPAHKPRQRSISPSRPSSSRQQSVYLQHRSGTPKHFRSSSGSSGSSTHDMTPRHSASNLLPVNVLPASKWRFLRHLSLAENGLTHLTASSLAPVAGTLQSLDLSGNHLTEIPDALATLTHLRALNLSNCMVNNLQSLVRNPLPAITTLNLRSNRLLSLVGIERLLSLERLDIRDNKLHDPTELARLTGIPDITDLYVIKNPFTKTHSNFRVTIFNLFRAAPGHQEDIVIDAMSPSYSERKQLIDRALELPNAQIVRPPSEDEGSPAQAGALPTLGQVPETRPTDSFIHDDANQSVGPMRRDSEKRKRVPRRRVIELSQAGSVPRIQTEALVPDLTELPSSKTPVEAQEIDKPDTTGPALFHTARTTQGDESEVRQQRPTINTAFTSPSPAPRREVSSSDDEDSGGGGGNSPVRPHHGVSSHTDIYRQKIEALRSELGPSWLAALGEDQLADQRNRNRSFSPESRATTVRPDKPGRGVSVGGRTLG